MAIALRSASLAERAELVARLVPDYAQAMVEAGEWGADQALQKAQRDVDGRLAAPGALQEVLCICAGGSGARLGDLWLQYRDEGGLTVCALLYVFIAAQARGRGHAFAALQAAEIRAWHRGARAMRLSVNGNNAAALALYRKLGYGVLNARMGKALQHQRQGDLP
jgi:ribosomal protein S18 acetylase RimI-like enzyme